MCIIAHIHKIFGRHSGTHPHNSARLLTLINSGYKALSPPPDKPWNEARPKTAPRSHPCRFGSLHHHLKRKWWRQSPLFAPCTCESQSILHRAVQLARCRDPPRFVPRSWNNDRWRSSVHSLNSYSMYFCINQHACDKIENMHPMKVSHYMVIAGDMKFDLDLYLQSLCQYDNVGAGRPMFSARHWFSWRVRLLFGVAVDLWLSMECDRQFQPLIHESIGITL